MKSILIFFHILITKLFWPFVFSGRFYYWDVINDSVSWLPPSHPRSIVTDSVAQFRFERHAIMQNMEKKTSDSEVNYFITWTILIY